MKAPIVLFASISVIAAAAAVRADEVEVLFDGTHVEVWDVARDAERLKHEFSLSEVKAATNPAVSKRSCGLTGVEFQQPAETLASDDLAGGLADSIGRFRKQDHVPLPWRVAFGVKVRNVMRPHWPQ
ncbi:MAG: hypothetical protein AAB676_17230 [Verrucomicrobiota bacterium]